MEFDNLSKDFEDGKLYRLDYIKGVDVEETQENIKVLYIRAVFSELSNQYRTISDLNNILTNDVFSLKSTFINEEKKQIEVPFDITLLPHIVPGSIWNNKTKVGDINSYINWFPNIELDLSSSKNVNICNVTNDHRFGLCNYYSNAIEITNARVNGKVRKVYIPTMEIIRFYFSGHEYLNEQLFHGGFNPENEQRLYSESNVDKDNAIVYLQLNRKCYDSDSEKVANALISPLYLKAIRKIYSSINWVFNNLGNREVSPQTLFPFFSQSLKLKGAGKYVKLSGNGGGLGYLLLNITESYHQKQVSKIILKTPECFQKNPRSIYKFKVEEQKKQNKDLRKYSQGNKPKNDIQKSNIEFESRPSTLTENIEIEKEELVSDKDESLVSILLEDKQEYDKVSSLPLGNKFNETVPVSIQGAKSNNMNQIPPSERIKVVCAVAKELKDLGAQVTSLPKNFVSNTMPFGLYVFASSDKHEDNTWCYTEKGNRRALFLQISTKVSTVYLLEIEGKGKNNYALYWLQDPKNGFMPDYFLNNIAINKGKELRKKVYDPSFNIILRKMHKDDKKQMHFKKKLKDDLSKTLGL